MLGLRPYNYESFQGTDLFRHAAKTAFGSGPGPGAEAPDFQIQTLDGDEIRLSDFYGEKNIVLTFGSATCPFTISSIGGMNDLYEEYEDREDVAFFFVYVREAHPGENFPAHGSMDDKIDAARRFQKEEKLKIPMLIDSLGGSAHRKYGKTANPTYVIDKAGRIAFRTLWTQPGVISGVLEALINLQDQEGNDHVVVGEGENSKVPLTQAAIHSYRALRRGGKKSVRDFKKNMGAPGKVAYQVSRAISPLSLTPARIMAGAGIAALVLAAGVFVGVKLRRMRLNRHFSPYRMAQPVPAGENDYAVGI